MLTWCTFSDYHFNWNGGTCIIGHDRDAADVGNGRCTGIFLDMLFITDAVNWVASRLSKN